jgi:DNA-binding response OmpR family regulator
MPLGTSFAPPASSIVTSIRLLFVDDEESILFAVRDYFGQRGYTVDVARDVKEAEALMADRTYGLAVIDLRLGPMQETAGLELARRVRERYPTTPVVLFTAYGSKEIEREARRCGAVYLEKPLSLESFGTVIDRLHTTGGHGPG